MPKIIELTVQIDVQRVSCPGVWLCQSGYVSLVVFALGASYQTCMVPPIFPLLFKDVFYFQKRFQETCALNNICCLLKDETIYCELVQWGDTGNSEKCVLLAQYLGALNDILFPPNMCSTDGVDLLMRRSNGFPGILSPKVEIATKVRIDELWSQNNKKAINISECKCESHLDTDGPRQKRVCHTSLYHRAKCYGIIPSSTARSRSRSVESRSCSSFRPQEASGCPISCRSVKRFRVHSSPSPRRCPARMHQAYYLETPCASPRHARNVKSCEDKMEYDDYIGHPCSRTTNSRQNTTDTYQPADDRLQKLMLESRYIDDVRHSSQIRTRRDHISRQPCVCDICRRYHDLFHSYSGDR